MAAAATSLLSLYTAASAFADADADGATVGSPGVLAGNNVQVPVSTPLNVCGNSVDVVGILNPAFGNSCGNDDAASSIAQDPLEEALPDAPAVPDAVTPAVPDAVTPAAPDAVTPAAPAGNADTPVTTVAVPRTDASVESPSTPDFEAAPAPQSATQVDYSTPSGTAPTLAETGSEDMLAASAAGAALLLGGAVLYRRGRVASRR